MSMMVIYLMDKDESDEIEVSAEYFGKDANSFDLGQKVLNSLLMLDGVSFVNRKAGSISSPPASTSLN